MRGSGGGGSGPDLLVHWEFNEGAGTTVADSSGNNNTLTLTSSSKWEVRDGDDCYLFSNARGEASADILAGRNQFTFCAEVEIDALDSYRNTLISLTKTSHDNTHCWLDYKSTSIPHVVRSDSTFTSFSGLHTVALKQRFVMGQDGTTTFIYFPDKSYESATTLDPLLLTSAEGGIFTVGQQARLSRYLQGVVFDLRVYGSVLSQTEAEAYIDGTL